MGRIASALAAVVFAATVSSAAAPLKTDPKAGCRDLLHPEGRTRWDLTLCTPPAAAAADRDALWLKPEAPASGRVLGSERTFELDQPTSAGVDRLFVRTQVTGAGWLHLPTGVRDVLLERLLVLRRAHGAPGFTPDRLVDRFLARDGTVLAAVWGRPSAEGKEREDILGAHLADVGEAGLVPLTRLYEDEVIGGVLHSVNYGWDRGKNALVSSLTSPSFANMGALVDASSWDFSGNGERHAIAGTTTANATTSITGVGTAFQTALVVGDKISLSSNPGQYARVTAISSNTQLTVASALGNGTTQNINRKSGEYTSTSVAVSAAETCNSTNCGYTIAGAIMDREDKNADEKTCSTATTTVCTVDANCPAGQTCVNRAIKTNAVSQRIETAGSDVTYWLRAGAQNEGLAGSLGEGESKFCYTTTGPTVRTPVPLWRFSHPDPGGYFLQVGDTWSSAPFACEQNLFNQICTASCGIFCQLYTKACNDHLGTQSGQVLKSGVVTLPSGHTFNALLVRTVADFCVYAFSGCGTPLSQVRTIVHLWQVPHLGTVVRLNSPQNGPADLRSFSTVDETNIAFGIFPPRTIQSTGASDTSVSLAWDPGLDTRRINGYRIYWDTDSGAGSGYAFDSINQAGQVAFAGTTAVISGLTPGTTYYFTVTARSTFTDPSSGVVTTYESERYPTQIFGDPGFVVPTEVQAATSGGTCTPTAEVTGLRVNKAAGGETQVCWNLSTDPCTTGYRVLGATSPLSDAGFATVADNGLSTCWTGPTGAGYFIVVARGSGGTGPWGHYGH